MKAALFTVCLAMLFTVATANAVQAPASLPHIAIQTSEGRIVVKLDPVAAPLTVNHILSLVDEQFFDGLVFHRVISGFMIQAGGYTPDYELKEDQRTVPNESGNNLSNSRGTIAMARTADPHSASSQFFINVVDNRQLDPAKAAGSGRWGYAVFGTVVEGMAVADRIAAVPTGRTDELSDVPETPVVIESIRRFVPE